MLGAIVAGVLSLLLRSWIAMLLIGAVHHEVSEKVPALGFDATVWVVLLVSVLVGGARAVDA